MRKKEEILRDMGVNEEHNPHAGILPDTKEVILVEVLIDIREILWDINMNLCSLIFGPERTEAHIPKKD